MVDVASGHLTTRRLEGGTLCHGLLMAAGDRAVWLSPAGRQQRAEARTLDLRGPARVLGRADMVLPAGEERLWLARLRYGRAIRVVDVRLVTTSGVTVMRSRHRAPVGYVQGATARALVVVRDGRGWEWEPRTGRVRRAPWTWLVAVHGRRSAWCTEGCQRVRLVGPGRDRRSGAVHGWTLDPRGSYSADGRLLALGATSLVEVAGEGMRIALVDTRTGATRVVPEAVLSSPTAFDWSPSGEWLYFAAPGRRVRAYRPADGRLVTLPRRLPGDILSLAAAG